MSHRAHLSTQRIATNIVNGAQSIRPASRRETEDAMKSPALLVILSLIWSLALPALAQDNDTPLPESTFRLLTLEEALERDEYLRSLPTAEPSILERSLVAMDPSDPNAIQETITRYTQQQLVDTPDDDAGTTPEVFPFSLSMNALPAAQLRCGIRIKQLDLDGDGTKEPYLMVSLLECGERNYVSRVRSQFGGTCQTFAAVGTLEIALAEALDKHRLLTANHGASAFAPLNFSESFSFDVSRWSPFKTLKKNYGTNLESFFPQTAASEDYSEKSADALENRYGKLTSHCQGIRNLSDMKGCVVDAAKQQGHVVYLPDRFEGIDVKKCIDTQNNNQQVACPATPYGKPTDRYQIDYLGIDMAVLAALVNGHPVETSIKWNWDGRTVSGIDAGHPDYEFAFYRPRPLDTYERAAGEPPVLWDDSKIGGKTYNFWSNHAVIIVGYLVGTDKQHYYIIKNSHGDRGSKIAGDRYKDRLVIVQTPGTSGAITAVDSTRRNLFIHSYSTRAGGFRGASSIYTVIKSLKAARMTGTVIRPQNLIFDTALFTHDRDGDRIVDVFDNCPGYSNPRQLDQDLDYVGDACDPCPTHYDRYQKRSDPAVPGNDWDNDGVPGLCDTRNPPSGVAAIGYSDPRPVTARLTPTVVGTIQSPSDSQAVMFPETRRATVAATATAATATAATATAATVTSVPHYTHLLDEFAIRGWRYGSKDTVRGIGDFDGDSIDDFVIQAGWGIGLIRSTGKRFTTLATSSYGRSIDRWLLHKDDRIEAVGKFLNNSRHQILIRSKGRLGLIGWDGSRLHTHRIVTNGQRMDEWLLNETDTILGVGDFDGDHRDEFVIRSGWGMGVIGLSTTGRFDALTMIKAGSRIPTVDGSGHWVAELHHPARDRFEGVGNLYGDAADEFILANDDYITVISLDGTHKARAVRIYSRWQKIGDWSYNHSPQGFVRDRVLAVGNFDGKGHDEFVLGGDRGTTLVLTGTGGPWQTTARVGEGEAIGGWRLSGKNHFHGAGDFDVDGREELVVSSGWGYVILSLNTNNTWRMAHIQKFGNWLGRWYVHQNNAITGVGYFGPGRSASFLTQSAY